MEVGSGNVFADLGLVDADELKTKVQLAVAIKREITARGWSQAEAADVLSINQPKVSALLRYKLDGFSVERLMNFLTALGHDVEIVIKPRRTGQHTGRILVEAAC
jgi:predicted XRE-type DNA-binding protein